MLYKTLTKKDNDFERMKTYIAKQATKLCTRGLRKDYVLDTALHAADAIVIAYEISKTRSGQERYNFFGFSLVRKMDDCAYLDVICARRVGTTLVGEVVKLAEMWGKPIVQLASIPPAMPFWLKVGFVNGHTPEWDPTLVEDAARVAQMKFASWEEAVEDPDMKAYLKKLVAKRHCASKKLRSLKKCNENGYVMTLDVTSKLGRPAAVARRRSSRLRNKLNV